MPAPTRVSPRARSHPVRRDGTLGPAARRVASGNDHHRRSPPRRLYRRPRRQQRRAGPRRRRTDRRRPGDGRPARSDPRPLAGLGVAPEAITHVFLSHHHPDHTINIALFPNAEVVDFWARYRDDLWLDHDGDGYHLAPNSELWLTPGHTEEDATLVVTRRRRRLRDDPPVVARGPDARDRPARRRPGRDRARSGARPGGRRHRDPGPRTVVPRPTALSVSGSSAAPRC